MPHIKSESHSKKIEDHRGLLLDISYGFPKEERFLCVRKDDGPDVDIVHDLEVFPYPFRDNECLTILVRGSMAYVKPWLTVNVFNELWRIAKDNAQLVVSIPYAGSPLYWSDPLHCNGFNENTFFYFDKSHSLWNVHKPKPWKITKGFPMWQTTGLMEAIMVKDNG